MQDFNCFDWALGHLSSTINNGGSMAGYLFTFSKEEEATECMKRGAYSTLMNPKWSSATEATLGDYVTMRPGDNVYFFSKRKIYGIGKIDSFEGAAVIENFKGATSTETIDIDKACLEAAYKDARDDKRIGRWIIKFTADPALFKMSVDMDDLLLTNPSAFRSLRVFEKRSFIKLDDDENAAFKAAVLRANWPNGQTIEINQPDWLRNISAPTGLQIKSLLSSNRQDCGSLSKEMLLEVGLLSQLASQEVETEKVFGHWDYLDHQVPASPNKPVMYMDRMDVFGYRWIPDTDRIVEKYIVAELKKDIAQGTDIAQVMRYVDWVRSEYAHSGYAMIEAYLVARSFDTNSLKRHLAEMVRYDVKGRPPMTHRWLSLKFVQYEVKEDGTIAFLPVGLDGDQ
ncbi:MAG: hypothetical protein KHX54_01965 [Collinsella sp.]|nr:hypothetical protein [Collinsella sp.]